MNGRMDEWMNDGQHILRARRRKVLKFGLKLLELLLLCNLTYGIKSKPIKPIIEIFIPDTHAFIRKYSRCLVFVKNNFFSLKSPVLQGGIELNSQLK